MSSLNGWKCQCTGGSYFQGMMRNFGERNIVIFICMMKLPNKITFSENRDRVIVWFERTVDNGNNAGSRSRHIRHWHELKVGMESRRSL